MYWYDGQLVSEDTIRLNTNEPGLLYGATVFTTIRVYQQSISHPLTSWKAHCDRLKQGIDTFNWQQPSWQYLREGAETLLSSFPVLRITIFADGRELITGRFLPSDLAQRQQEGIAAWVASNTLFRRDIATYKTGNYLGAYLALQQARKLGAQEAILINSNGNWLETSTGNLWGWREGCWYTPSLDNEILPGISRSQLLNYLRKHNIPVYENIWTPKFVRDLQAIAYSNCVVEIVPIHTVKDKRDRNIASRVHQQLRNYFSSH